MGCDNSAHFAFLIRAPPLSHTASRPLFPDTPPTLRQHSPDTRITALVEVTLSLSAIPRFDSRAARFSYLNDLQASPTPNAQYDMPMTAATFTLPWH